MIYRSERRRDCQFVFAVSHLTFWRRIAGVSFFSRSRATGCPRYLFFLDCYSTHRWSPAFSAEEGKRWSLSSHLIIQSVGTGACVSPPGKPNIATESEEQDYLKVQFPPPMLRRDKMCLPNANFHIKRYYSQGRKCVNWTGGGMKMITGSHKGLFH